MGQTMVNTELLRYPGYSCVIVFVLLVFVCIGLALAIVKQSIILADTLVWSPMLWRRKAIATWRSYLAIHNW